MRTLPALLRGMKLSSLSSIPQLVPIAFNSQKFMMRLPRKFTVNHRLAMNLLLLTSRKTKKLPLISKSLVSPVSRSTFQARLSPTKAQEPMKPFLISSKVPKKANQSQPAQSHKYHLHLSSFTTLPKQAHSNFCQPSSQDTQFIISRKDQNKKLCFDSKLNQHTAENLPWKKFQNGFSKRLTQFL